MEDSVGLKHPILEGEYDMAFKAWRCDQPRSTILDGFNCVEAKGMKRQPQILDAYVSSGRVAYALLRTNLKLDGVYYPKVWRRFILAKRAQDVRDAFEI